MFGFGKTRLIVQDTHRALWYEDGILVGVRGAGRYDIPTEINFGPFRRPRVEFCLVDIRQREITIKNQEVLTVDKVAVRVSLIVQFRVTDPRAAIHEVDNYEARIYSDVQLAARRALASMTLEEIMTNRNRLSGEILGEVKEGAASFGVAILRADVKDLVFPGNLQEVMNRVLTAERNSQAALVEARTKAEREKIEATARAEVQRIEAEANAQSAKLRYEAEAEGSRIAAEAKRATLELQREQSELLKEPGFRRAMELEALKEMARVANARIYLGDILRIKDE